MSGQEVTYTLDFGVRGCGGWENQAARRPSETAVCPIPRIARLLALAIRLDGLIREQTIPDYAEDDGEDERRFTRELRSRGRAEMKS